MAKTSVNSFDVVVHQVIGTVEASGSQFVITDEQAQDLAHGNIEVSSLHPMRAEDVAMNFIAAYDASGEFEFTVPAHFAPGQYSDVSLKVTVERSDDKRD